MRKASTNWLGVAATLLIAAVLTVFRETFSWLWSKVLDGVADLIGRDRLQVSAPDISVLDIIGLVAIVSGVIIILICINNIKDNAYKKIDMYKMRDDSSTLRSDAGGSDKPDATLGQAFFYVYNDSILKDEYKDVFSVVGELRRAASSGMVPLWGRKLLAGDPLRFSDMHVKIPSEYWNNNMISAHNIFSDDAPATYSESLGKSVIIPDTYTDLRTNKKSVVREWPPGF